MNRLLTAMDWMCRRGRTAGHPLAAASFETMDRPVPWWLPALLAAIALGCQRAPVIEEPPDDEAMVRARREGKTPQQAARDYFYPAKIVDYFPQMDTVGRPVRDGT